MYLKFNFNKYTTFFSKKQTFNTLNDIYYI